MVRGALAPPPPFAACVPALAGLAPCALEESPAGAAVVSRWTPAGDVVAISAAATLTRVGRCLLSAGWRLEDAPSDSAPPPPAGGWRAVRLAIAPLRSEGAARLEVACRPPAPAARSAAIACSLSLEHHSQDAAAISPAGALPRPQNR